jgi:hypothetical protein
MGVDVPRVIGAKVSPKPLIGSIYLYLVCFASLLIAVFAVVNLVGGVVELVYPDPGMAYYAPIPKEGADAATIAEQQRISRESATRNSVIRLISAGTTLALVGPIYLYHWKRVRKPEPVPPSAGPVPISAS